MKHTHRNDFGRPETAVQRVSTTANDPTGMVDKWQALEALSDASAVHGISHRTLGVLRALLTFLPGRLISPVSEEATVFPSNRTLSHRLNGMPESTLRRHLAALVSRGIVSRRDSPNRKRYRRNAGQGAGITFGLDVSPLARWITDFLQEATRVKERMQALGVLRAQVAELRARVLDQCGPDGTTEEARRALRRKPCDATLRALQADLELRLTTCAASEMSGTDARNERHIQSKSIFISDSEVDISMRYSDGEPRKGAENDGARIGCSGPKADQEPTLDRVLRTCTEFRCYFPEVVQSWREIVSIASRLSPMIGIDPPVFREAGTTMGLKTAAIAVLCIVESLDRIRSPGAYLRDLTQKSRTRGFSVRPLLDAIENRRVVS